MKTRRSSRIHVQTDKIYPSMFQSESTHNPLAVPPSELAKLTKLRFTVNVPLYLKYTAQIVRDLIKLDEHGDFSVPVDPIRLNCPTYFDIVKNPQDLGSIKKGLETGKYQSAEDVVKDVQQVWENCRLFNSADHNLIPYCNRLEEEATKRFSKLPAWVIEQRLPSDEEIAELPLRDQRYIRTQLDDYSPQVVHRSRPSKPMVQTDGAWNGDDSASDEYEDIHDLPDTVSKRKEKKPQQQKREPQYDLDRPSATHEEGVITYEQIQEITEAVEMLNDDEEQDFIKIVDSEAQTHDDGDVSVDLKNLSKVTLSRLYQFIQRIKVNRQNQESEMLLDDFEVPDVDI
ncbi:hypothetical protein BLNAU_11498 [Blattamonas nauphoetae]|uniref:Bromo domain-containing protein n=1 Tax=Blattamonas nauphoetae TaxID=2049346 RepID=A0ABQ9XM61_9EUKA|nr:hypothetical protein BLNAU_11498 [Blattamonas nauphoetae]